MLGINLTILYAENIYNYYLPCLHFYFTTCSKILIVMDGQRGGGGGGNGVEWKEKANQKGSESYFLLFNL